MADIQWGSPKITVENILDSNYNLHLKKAEQALIEKDYDKALIEVTYAEAVANDNEDVIKQCNKIKNVLNKIGYGNKNGTLWSEIEQRAEKGNIDALLFLSGVYLFGFSNTVEPDERKGFSYCVKAYKIDNKVAHLYLGICYHNGLGVQQNYKLAQKYYIEAIRNHYEDEYSCCFMLGLMYLGGDGCNKDVKKGIQLIQIATKDENIKAEVYSTLASIYYKYDGLTPDYKKVYDYATKAANLGDPRGKHILAMCNIEGIGCQKNLQKGIQLLETAAECGEVKAYEELMKIYLGFYDEFNNYIETDHKKAFFYAEKAVELGSISSIWMFASGYLDPEKLGLDGIIEQNIEKAFHLLKFAAKKGDCTSMATYGVVLAEEKLGHVDYREALYWLRKAESMGASVQEHIKQIDEKMKNEENTIDSIQEQGNCDNQDHIKKPGLLELIDEERQQLVDGITTFLGISEMNKWIIDILGYALIYIVIVLIISNPVSLTIAIMLIKYYYKD